MARSSAYIETSRHSVYYFRIRVPLAARTAIACTHIRRSLKTKCRREAVVRGAELLDQIEPLFEAAERGDIVDVQSLTWSPKAKSSHSQGEAMVVPEQPGEPCLRLSEVWIRYKREQELEGIRKKTIDDKASQVGLLQRIVGDVPIRNVDRALAQRFKETALQLPPRINYLTGQSINQVIKNAQITISTTTFNNYVKNITTVFAYAKREGFCDTNPFEGLKIRQKAKSSTARARFSERDLAQLFDPQHYPNQNQKLRYRYWLPYLALYTGARLNELAQLYLDDFVEVKGISCIHIREQRSDQRLKNLSSERLVPVHHKLKALGLFNVVDELKGRGVERLFPELSWSEYHGYGVAPSIWFARYSGSLGLKDGVVRKDFHSFRHTVADHLKQKGVTESHVGGLLGHTTGGITFSRYGKEYEPESLLPIVELLDFDIAGASNL